MIIKYRPEIDGLRALAVIPVILYHAGFTLFCGGFVGVDIFLVISGYLITSIILAEVSDQKFSIARFYERRARRILPALFFVVLCTSAFAYLWMPPKDIKDFSRSVASVVFFVSNIFFKREAGYFETSADLKPLLHTWSLALEEQYYVLAPIFVLIAWRFFRKYLVHAIVVVGIASLAMAQWASLYKPNDAFFLLPSRAWEFTVGALTAIYLRRNINGVTASVAVANTACLIGLLCIGYAVFYIDRATPFPGVYALFPTIGAALLIVFVDSRTIVGRLLSAKIVVGVGLISYSAYLWHHPIFVLSRYYAGGEVSIETLCILILLSFGLAYFSWRYVEAPFRSRNVIGARAVCIAAVSCAILLVAGSGAGISTNGFEESYLNRLSQNERQIYVEVSTTTGGNLEKDMQRDGECRFWSKDVNEDFLVQFDKCAGKLGQAVIVLGDSHAMNIYNALFRAEFSTFLVGLSQGGCRPVKSEAYCQYEKFEAFLRTHARAVRYVIFHQAGIFLLKEERPLASTNRIVLGSRTYATNYSDIGILVSYLNRLSSHSRVVWLGPFVEPQIDFRNIRYFESNGFVIPPKNIAAFDLLDQDISNFATKPENRFTYISLSKILGIDPSFLKQGSCVTFRDMDHFSLCGEKIVGDKLKAAFDKMQTAVQ